ncbi:ketopantoate reductase PanE/ApbA C terminal-domain-containing protein [Schizophyllum amplum]|uniref:2-dehydropantoate 2-reductase n=1 Tax=Schizophyllum amplum TaxID=97359 RepID=A0A550CMS8_9AGAR|nr:ketopantoate reductase PanE/ApbA C terminal-domain-containing protein [Auriculariopsis ampla]
MRFHVVGLGPVGTLAAFHLRRAVPRETPISLIHRRQRTDTVLKVERDGVVSFENEFENEYLPNAQLEDAQGTGGLTNIQSLIVATKAQATCGVIDALLPHISRNTTIVLLQNGMGIYERLVSTVFRNPANRPHFIHTVNTHGVTVRTQRSHVIHRGVGALKFAIVPSINRDFEKTLRNPDVPAHERQLELSDISTPDDAEAEQYRSLLMTVAALSVMDLNTVWTPFEELRVAMYQKLAVNAIINPLTALLRCTNGELLEQQAFNNIAHKVSIEAARIFHKIYMQRFEEEDRIMHDQGLSRRAPPEVPQALTSTSLHAEAVRVAGSTAKNTSSMLYDVLHNRPTEVNFINGHLCRLGKEHGIQTLTTKTLWDMMQLREAIPLDSIV